jgi:phytoene dehydrogenase-like protein
VTAPRSLDAVVVGAGPNGLSAAIALARAGRSVRVLEAADTVGGGARSAALTLPGFLHDVCSAIHPMAVGSPFLRELPLSEHGLEWIDPVPIAHPLDDGSVVLLERSLDATAAALGADREAYRRLMRPLTDCADALFEELLAPAHLPRHPLLLARFGLSGLRPATGLARGLFSADAARALFAGIAAHSMLRLEQRPSAAVGVVMAIAGHAYGWPVPRGGSQRISDALAAYLRAIGGEVVTGHRVSSYRELPPARAYLFDQSPRQLIEIAGDELPSRYLARLARYRYGPGVFKLDFALSQPIPWDAARCGEAGTVHVGGDLAEIAAAERTVADGGHSERPFVLVAQPSLFDPSRAPAGSHTAWAYCHVPNGSTIDMSARIEAQIERFAPGFRDCVLACSAMGPAELEAYNANYIGGDINGGVQDLRQLFTRPVARVDPYSTPNERIFLSSASTPPGGGVHGMSGYHAARSALRGPLR